MKTAVLLPTLILMNGKTINQFVKYFLQFFLFCFRLFFRLSLLMHVTLAIFEFNEYYSQNKENLNILKLIIYNHSVVFRYKSDLKTI